jgi:hypothetical protein
MDIRETFSTEERIDTAYGRFWIYPIVGFFDISTFDVLPFGRFSIKVVQREKDFLALPNVVVYNSTTKCQEHICGLGTTVREAVLNCIEMFMSEAKKQVANKVDGELDESDFVWLNWQPYREC